MDSCAFYPPQKLEKEASNRLFDLYDKGKLDIEVPYGVVYELSKLNHPVSNKLLDKVHTVPVTLTSEEYHQMRDIQQVLFSDKRDLQPNDKIDIENVFEAIKHGCAFFVTCDKRHILSKAHELYERFHLQVMCPSDSLKRIETYISNPNAFYSQLFKDHP